MSYRVSRNGQMYGPYSLDDLRRYLASGNLLPTDMAKSDGMADWVPVSTLVQSQPPPMDASAFGMPSFAAPSPAFAATQASPYEPAPNLHWGLLLLLSIVTLGAFTIVWDILLATWVKKIAPASPMPVLYYFCAALIACQLAGRFMNHSAMPLYSVVALTSVVLQLVTRFKMRTLLEYHYNTVEPVGLMLSGIMTFFFGELYFQYHLNRINRFKQQVAFNM